MSTTTKAHVTLDIIDVRRAGGVEQAIIAWSKDSDTTSAGPVGSRMQGTHYGPSWNSDASDYAREAIAGGAMHYLDETDGRLATAYETDDEDGICCEGGVYDFDWSDDSVVCLECPDIEDAIEEPKFAAEMAQAVIDYHGAKSDKAEWIKLIKAIKAAAETFSDIDEDRLED